VTREEERVRAGLARIRRLRVMAPLATVAALVAGVNGAWFFELGYPCVPIGLSAVAIYSVLAFVHHRCPRCGEPFFLQSSDAGASPLARRLDVRPLSRACRSCGLALESHAHA